MQELRIDTLLNDVSTLFYIIRLLHLLQLLISQFKQTRTMIPQQWASPCGNQCTQKYAALTQIPCNYFPFYLNPSSSAAVSSVVFVIFRMFKCVCMYKHYILSLWNFVIRFIDPSIILLVYILLCIVLMFQYQRTVINGLYCGCGFYKANSSKQLCVAYWGKLI